MRVPVELDTRGYDVLIESGARHGLADLLARCAPQARRVVLVTTESLKKQSWFDLESGLDQDVVTVPDGEGAKTLANLEDLLETFAVRGISRDDVVVAVGGGSVTDLVGFAASTYLRGVGYVAVPTSLVGQVDAAIGGKTGVNLRAGKNLAGTFYQPLGVLADPDVLATLPARELQSGLGEVAKCWLLEGRQANEVAAASLATLVERSVRVKVRLVVKDEREGADRVLLNYGHTLAHALEAAALARGSSRRHGEAVAIGLAFAPRLAHALGLVESSVVLEHDATLAAFGLDRRLSTKEDPTTLVDYMARDKKARHDLAFVLPTLEGFRLVSGLDATVVAEQLVRYQGEA